MNGFRFQDPLWMLLLIPLIACGWLAIRRQRRSVVMYSSIEILKALPQTLALRVKRLLPWLKIVGLGLVVVALARPQHGREEFRVRTEGVSIEMCVDRSGSMLAQDFVLDQDRVNRLEAVKHVLHQFVAGDGEFDGRPDDLIGVVGFGGFADAVCPQTLDHGALLEVLKSLEVAAPVRDATGRVINADLLREEQATAIGDAVALAVDRLKDVEAKSKVIILLSDGENTAGVVEPQEAAEAAESFGVKIYSVGVGTTGMAPFPAVDPFGRDVLSPRPVRLDETTLKMLAETTGGRYFNAQDTQTLEQVYAEIDKLEKTETEGRLYTEYRELFQYWMVSGLCCVLLEVLLASTRFRSLP